MKRFRTIGIMLVVAHFFEALTAAFVAKRKGENPVKYFGKTLFMGVFVLIPLILRSSEKS